MLGPHAVARLKTLEGSVHFLKRLHEKLPRRRISSNEFVNELFHWGALVVGETNLNTVFAEIDDEAARTLMAQVVIAFSVWDPLSLFAPGDIEPNEFERHLAVELAGMSLAEEVGKLIGKNGVHVLKEVHPPILVNEVLFCTLLHIMKRPLAYLYPTREFRAMLADGRHLFLPLDANIRERHATALHAASGEAFPRELALQCPPIPPHPDEAAGMPPTVNLLRFTPEEVFASYACGERVLEFVRTQWNWQVLEETAALPVN